MENQINADHQQEIINSANGMDPVDVERAIFEHFIEYMLARFKKTGQFTPEDYDFWVEETTHFWKLTNHHRFGNPGIIRRLIRLTLKQKDFLDNIKQPA